MAGSSLHPKAQPVHTSNTRFPVIPTIDSQARCAYRDDKQGITAAELASFLSSLPSPPADTDATVEKLLLARVIAPVSGAATPSYQLTDDARPTTLPTGTPLNCHIEWYGQARAAVDVSGDLRGRILELYDAYLAPDGKAVDYDGMKDDARFAAYVDATVELTKVDVSQLNRDGA